tara:strand:+ start:13042 stop:13635 length:594 start_codon:yes stop_codon:yes gene_type:complete
MKKRLLNEQTTRRMMKLANMPALAENFIEETEEMEEGMGVYDRDDDEAPPIDDMPIDDAPVDDEEAVEDVPLEDEAPPVDMEPEVGAPEEGSEVAQVQDALVNALTLLSNLPGAKPVEVEGEGEGELAEPVVDELPPEEAAPVGDELPAEEEADEIEEELAAADITLEEEEVVNEDDIINEVTKRVAQRLLQEAAKQ